MSTTGPCLMLWPGNGLGNMLCGMLYLPKPKDNKKYIFNLKTIFGVFWRFLSIFLSIFLSAIVVFDAVARQWTWKYAMWDALSAKR